MLKNLQKELGDLRQELMNSLIGTMPSKEFRATIIMAMVGLHMIEFRIRKTQNLEERRQLIHEFNRGKDTVKKGLQALKQSTQKRSTYSEQKLRKAVP